MLLTDIGACPRHCNTQCIKTVHKMFKHLPVLVHHPFQLGTGNTESNLPLAFHCSCLDFPPRPAAVSSVLLSLLSVRYH